MPRIVGKHQELEKAKNLIKLSNGEGVIFLFKNLAAPFDKKHIRDKQNLNKKSNKFDVRQTGC